MAGKLTVACTKEQYETLITTIFQGVGTAIKPNPRIATILEIEANTGLRIGDVLNLHRGDIIKDGHRYRFNITEQKTGKKRSFTVPNQVYSFIEDYCETAGIDNGNVIFPITVRAVEKHLARVTDYLGEGYENVSTHSLRKFWGTNLYYDNGCDIELVRRLYQHSSASITSRYLGITDKRMDAALEKNVNIINRSGGNEKTRGRFNRKDVQLSVC